MLYRCDRCGELIDGFEDEGGTAGFYYVDEGHWAAFALPYEVIVCDACMWSDPGYSLIFGRTSSYKAKTPKKFEESRTICR